MAKRPDVQRRRVFTAWALSLIAGMVDAIGSLRLGHVLLANMSGNTVRVGTEGGDGAWGEALRSAWPVVTFLMGLVVTGVVHEIGRRRRLNWLWAVLLVEALLLLAVSALGAGRTAGARAPTPLLVALGAGAMGMQNASLTRAAGVTLFTTHVTGTLTKLGQSLVTSIFWAHDVRRRGGHRPWREWVQLASGERAVREAGVMAGLWGLFLLGTLFAAVADRAWGFSSLLVPCALLTALAAHLRRHPLPPEERRPSPHAPPSP